MYPWSVTEGRVPLTLPRKDLERTSICDIAWICSLRCGALGGCADFFWRSCLVSGSWHRCPHGVKKPCLRSHRPLTSSCEDRASRLSAGAPPFIPRPEVKPPLHRPPDRLGLGRSHAAMYVRPGMGSTVLFDSTLTGGTLFPHGRDVWSGMGPGKEWGNAAPKTV